MRPLPTQDEALHELDAEMPALRSVVDKAFTAWQAREQMSAESHIPTGTSMSIKATDVYGMMVHFAKEHYDGREGRPEAKKYNGIFGVMLAGRYFVRFKKLNAALDVANHSSRQDEKYRRQIPFGELADAQVYLYVGYRHDKPFTQVEGVHLVCRMSDVVEWQINLTTMVKEESLTIPFTVAAPVKERRVRVRKTGTDGDQATGTHG